MLFNRETIDNLLPKRLGQVEGIVLSIPKQELTGSSDNQLISKYFSKVLITPVTLSQPQQIGKREAGIDSMVYTYAIPLAGDSEILTYKHVTNRPDKHQPVNSELSPDRITNTFTLTGNEGTDLLEEELADWHGYIAKELLPLNLYIEQQQFNKSIREHITSVLKTRRANLSR